VEFLAGLAGGGAVLELAMGTGRVALPLAARGIAVEGVEALAVTDDAAIIEVVRHDAAAQRAGAARADRASHRLVGPARQRSRA
jgi:hypothetical protein